VSCWSIHLSRFNCSLISIGSASVIFFLKVETAISTYNTSNGKMNITGWSGCINRIKL